MRTSWLLLLLLPACASAGGSSDGTLIGGTGGAQGGSAGSAQGGKAGTTTAGSGGKDAPGGRSGSGGESSTGGAAGQGGAANAGQAGQGGATGGTAGVSGAGMGGAGASGAGAGGAGAGGAGAGAGGTSAGGAGAGGAGAGGAGAGGAGAGGAGATQGGASQGGAGSGQGGAGMGQGGAATNKCTTATTSTVAPAQPLQITGNTGVETNYLGAYCDPLGASGRDTVYKVIPQASGKITVQLTAQDGSYDPVLAVTEESCTVFVTNKDGSCANFSGPGGGEKLTVDATASQPFWVYVDGVKGNDGPFALSVAYEGAGGAAGSSGQGGSAGAPPAEGQSCAEAVKVAVGGGQTVSVTGSTAAAKNTFFGYCNLTYDANDQVYEVTAQAAGKLVAKLEPLASDLDVALYGLKGPCTTVVTLPDTNNGAGDCSETFGPGVAETLDPLTVTQGEKVYLYVDTNKKNKVAGGPFKLTLTLN